MTKPHFAIKPAFWGYIAVKPFCQSGFDASHNCRPAGRLNIWVGEMRSDRVLAVIETFSVILRLVRRIQGLTPYDLVLRRNWITRINRVMTGGQGGDLLPSNESTSRILVWKCMRRRCLHSRDGALFVFYD